MASFEINQVYKQEIGFKFVGNAYPYTICQYSITTRVNKWTMISSCLGDILQYFSLTVINTDPLIKSAEASQRPFQRNVMLRLGFLTKSGIWEQIVINKQC